MTHAIVHAQWWSGLQNGFPCYEIAAWTQATNLWLVYICRKRKWPGMTHFHSTIHEYVSCVCYWLELELQGAKHVIAQDSWVPASSTVGPCFRHDTCYELVVVVFTRRYHGSGEITRRATFHDQRWLAIRINSFVRNIYYVILFLPCIHTSHTVSFKVNATHLVRGWTNLCIACRHWMASATRVHGSTHGDFPC